MITALIPAFLLAIPLSSISIMNMTDRDTVETWEGSLRLFGNEPFTRIALFTDDGERWYLDMDENELRQLWQQDRGRIRITGVPVVREFAGRSEQYIKVVKYEWISDNG